MNELTISGNDVLSFSIWNRIIAIFWPYLTNILRNFIIELFLKLEISKKKLSIHISFSRSNRHGPIV